MELSIVLMIILPAHIHCSKDGDRYVLPSERTTAEPLVSILLSSFLLMHLLIIVLIVRSLATYIVIATHISVAASRASIISTRSAIPHLFGVIAHPCLVLIRANFILFVHYRSCQYFISHV